LVARLLGLRFRKIETYDRAAVAPRDQIQPARSVQVSGLRTGASAARSKQHPANPQHSLVEQTRQFGEVTCSEAPRSDGRPGQPHFELSVKGGDRR
jgi:hypothetical protein